MASAGSSRNAGPYLRRASVTCSRGVAATRLHGIYASDLHGISTWQPRRRRDPSAEYPRGVAATRLRNIHAAKVRQVSRRVGGTPGRVGVERNDGSPRIRYYASGPPGATSIERIAAQYGRQAVVVSLDPRRVWLAADGAPPELGGGTPLPKVAVHATARGPAGETRCWYRATTAGGRKDAPICAVAVCAAAAALGAGEFMVNCIDADGKCAGYDLGLLQLVKAAVDVPVIASSGAGKPEHFAEAFRGAGVDAALAAGIFHRKEVSIQEVKAHLAGEGFAVREA